MGLKERGGGIDRLLALCLAGTRFGFSSGFALLCAELISGFSPLHLRSVVFAISGATSAVFYWWLVGAIIRYAYRQRPRRGRSRTGRAMSPKHPDRDKPGR